MKIYIVILLGFIRTTDSSYKYTDQDFEVLKHMTKYLDSHCFVFIENGRDLGLPRRIKTFPGRDMYSTVLNMSSLENVLMKNVTQFRFFQSRTIIVTKEDLNLTKILSEILVPRMLTWVIFKEYTPQKENYIPSSSDVFFVHSTSDLVTVEQVYHLKPNTLEMVQNVWKWVPSLTHIKRPFTVVLSKKNHHKISLKMHYLFNDSICLNPHGCPIKTKVECLQRSLLELMSEQLNFSIDPEECIEKDHPYSYPNGTDSEVFVRLNERTVDFSVVGHVVRSSKLSTYDLVWPTFVLKSMMYIRQGRLSGRWKSYLRPLDTSIWWTLLFWISMFGLFLLVFEKILLNKLKWGISLVLDYVNSIFRVLQVFCNQAVTDIPTSNSIRILYLMKLIVFIVFFQAYCGYLVSSLTIFTPHYPFLDLKGFFDNQEYQMLTLRRGFQRYYFRKVIGVGKRENFMLPDETLPHTVQEAISTLCTNDHLAFVEFREDLRDVEPFECRIAQLPHPVVTLFLAIALPRNSPYTELLTRELIRFQSTGIAQRLNIHLLSSTKFHKKSEEEYWTVSINEVFSVFILLAGGIIVSLVVFTVEVVLREVTLRRHCKKRRNIIEVKKLLL